MLKNKLAFFLIAVVVVLQLGGCSSPVPAGLFTSLPASATGVSFVNKPLEKETLSILYYLYYYNGSGVAIADVNADGLPDIYFGANNPGGNKLFINKGGFKFEDVTEAAGVAGKADWTTGVTITDVNGDGRPDIYVLAVAGAHGLTGQNQLFINNGDGTFTDSAAAYGLDFSGFSTQAAFFDFDNDGDLDCYLLNQSSRPNQNIRDTSGRRTPDKLSGDRLYRNDGGHFTDVSSAAGIYQSSLGYGLGLAVADFNHDGWPDIYVGNDFHENDYYYLNNGNGTFTESGAKHFGHYSRFSMGNDAADVNNDGEPDIISVDMLPPDEKTLKTYGSDEHFDIYNQKLIANGYQQQVSRNCLQMNNGNGARFTDVALMAGVSATDWSWSPLLADFDNDGNKDLFVSSGIKKRPVDMDYIKYRVNPETSRALNSSGKYDASALEKIPDGASHPFFFQGTGTGNFSDSGIAWGTADLHGYFNGAAYADLDNDGNLDLVVNALESPALVLRNNAPHKKSLSITFRGSGGNSAGIGAEAWIFSKGKMQYQQLMPTRGFMSSSDLRLHFGMDTTLAADSVLIVWPGNRYQLLRNVPANVPLIVAQAAAEKGFSYAAFFPKPMPALEAVAAPASWTQKENKYVDFNTEYLIPHMESTKGPKVAVADVNGDGLEDFFVCGPSGQAGALFIQNRKGKFSRAEQAVFEKNISSEAVDALFFDANGDGHPDLYVVSGGNEEDDNSASLADHLYLNDGKGQFSEGALPAMLQNKSCVAAADVDHDGDIDLFVGGFTPAKSFGVPQPSHLLLNDGKGHFQDAPAAAFPRENTGFPVASAFADTDQDGWTDLILAGEWMPVTIYHNDHGRFTKTQLPSSSGLWQSLYVTDLNGDGYPDLMAGNWGHNSKLWAGKGGPLKLYVKDFDNNGTTEQVMAYTINGQQYPFLAKDELEHALPVLKKAYLTYGEVAGKTVSDIFFDLFKNYRELTAETLSSSRFMNDGKGGFIRTDLPDALQQSPIFAFADESGRANLSSARPSSVDMPKPAQPSRDFIAGGNFYGVLPYEGRYDALPLTLFHPDGIKPTEATSVIPSPGGEIRDLKWVHGSDNTPTLIVARNNDSLLFFQKKTELK